MKSTHKRIDNIDLLKGITMIAVVWLHTIHPHIIGLIPVNALFFILSGIFFHDEPFIPFLRKRIRTLLLPFFTFYIFSYFFRIVTYILQHHNLQNFHWAAIFDLFIISDTSNYLSVNIPLWFLICLFVIQLLFWCLNHLIPKRYRTIGILSVFVILYISYPYITHWESPFMLNIALECLPFFIFGNLFGLAITRYITRIHYPYLWAVAFLALFIILQYIPIHWGIIDFIQAVALYISLLAILPHSNNKKNLIYKVIRNIGKSTMLILGLHVLILAIMQKIMYAIIGETLLSGTICLLSTLTIIYLVSPIFNRYFPWVVGKKRE